LEYEEEEVDGDGEGAFASSMVFLSPGKLDPWTGRKTRRDKDAHWNRPKHFRIGGGFDNGVLHTFRLKLFDSCKDMCKEVSPM
jgi:hypothetical protein